jgi:hypothetical protein
VPGFASIVISAPGANGRRFASPSSSAEIAGTPKSEGVAAAEKHARHFAAGREVEIALEVREQRRDIFGLRKIFRPGVRVEIAVRAFADAPGQVHIDRDRRVHAGIVWIAGGQP